MQDSTNTATGDRRLIYGLAILQFFIGIGAIAGGLGIVLDPSGSSIGLPIELLDETPFADFLIPGLVLLTVNGLGSTVGGVLTLRRNRYAGLVAIALGIFLVAWIVIQVLWIRGLGWLHAFYFFLGLAEAIYGNRLRILATDGHR